MFPLRFSFVSPRCGSYFPAMKTPAELERAAALQVAALMAAAARTAPKTCGIDNIKTAVIDDEPTKQKVIAKMREIATKESRPGLARDAGNITNSPALVLIGVESNPAGLNCGFCGKPTCEALEMAGGTCAFNSIDLGMATMSAAEAAGRFHIDNRIMYSIGRACLDLGMFGPKVKQALGIPLSVTGKNPFFDRKA
jgi:uncharacterized ferredoxin-like protein